MINLFHIAPKIRIPRQWKFFSEEFPGRWKRYVTRRHLDWDVCSLQNYYGTENTNIQYTSEMYDGSQALICGIHLCLRRVSISTSENPVWATKSQFIHIGNSTWLALVFLTWKKSQRDSQAYFFLESSNFPFQVDHNMFRFRGGQWK